MLGTEFFSRHGDRIFIAIYKKSENMNLKTTRLTHLKHGKDQLIDKDS